MDSSQPDQLIGYPRDALVNQDGVRLALTAAVQDLRGLERVTTSAAPRVIQHKAARSVHGHNSLAELSAPATTVRIDVRSWPLAATRHGLPGCQSNNLMPRLAESQYCNSRSWCV